MASFISTFIAVVEEQIQEASALSITFSVTKFVSIVLLLGYVYQVYGGLAAVGAYIGLFVVFWLFGYSLNDRQKINTCSTGDDSHQFTVEENETGTKITVEETVDGAVILGFEDETNLAEPSTPVRELHSGDTVVLSRDESTITIDTGETTETKEVQKQPELFIHTFTLFESYENRIPSGSHFNQGDIQ